jgi:hypothetical protein
MIRVSTNRTGTVDYSIINLNRKSEFADTDKVVYYSSIEIEWGTVL